MLHRKSWITDTFNVVRRDIPLNFVRGFCMGASDVVPGVSGGTIALIFGIYERLVHAVHEGARALGRFVKGDVSGGVDKLKEIDWLFLGSLLAGIGTAVVTLAKVLEHLLESEPLKMNGLFFGLVAASIFVAWSHIRTHDATRYAVLVTAAVATFVLMGIKSADASEPSLVFLFAAGAIAITAMILPGISGSFLLLMLGLYEYVIGAVSDRDLVVVAVFGAGAVVGLALFSSALDWLLQHHHDTMIAGLVGLMAGSLRVLWPWPEGMENASLGVPQGEVLAPVVLAVAAAAVVIAVGFIGRHHERRRDEAIQAELEEVKRELASGAPRLAVVQGGRSEEIYNVSEQQQPAPRQPVRPQPQVQHRAPHQPGPPAPQAPSAPQARQFAPAEGLATPTVVGARQVAEQVRSQPGIQLPEVKPVEVPPWVHRGDPYI